ncbi:MAG: hypothetical protein JWR60_909 [Polaromonas sp.]|nr:hypothetical protein [Polaromonas sp.]
MDKSKLSDEEWAKLAGVLKKTPGIRRGCEATCRRFVEAVLWILRAGALVAASTGLIWTLEQRLQAFCLFDAGLKFGTRCWPMYQPRLTWRMSASTAPWFGRMHALRALPRATRLPRRWAVRAVVLVARCTCSQMHWACPYASFSREVSRPMLPKRSPS